MSGKAKNKRIRIEVVEGVEGPSLYIDDTRVAGNKPWGGGRLAYKFELDVERVKEVLAIFEKGK